MNDEQQPRKGGKGGRPPKDAPIVYRYSVNFSEEEHARYLTLFEQSGLHSHARFIAARVFADEFHVVKTDKTLLEYVSRLTAFYAQYRAVGVNYNQVVKELHSHFSEKKTFAQLNKLEGLTRELIAITAEILTLSREFQTDGCKNNDRK
jgi:hypothetical protein